MRSIESEIPSLQAQSRRCMVGSSSCALFFSCIPHGVFYASCWVRVAQSTQAFRAADRARHTLGITTQYIIHMTVPALSSGRRSAHPRRSDHSVRRACQCAVATIFDISAHSHAGPLGLGSCFEESRSWSRFRGNLNDSPQESFSCLLLQDLCESCARE